MPLIEEEQGSALPVLYSPLALHPSPLTPLLMPVDYDVVIIGGSLAGRYAAIAATQFHATVALVEPPTSQQTIFNNLLTLHAASYLTKCHESSSEISILIKWAKGAVANVEEQYSPAVVAALGVDFIVGNGKFEQPALSFVVNQRQLKARSYLLATASRPRIPNIEGIQATGYYTAAEVLEVLTTQNAPTQWAILGGDPVAIQLAQILTRLGLDVTLIVQHSRLLPQEDAEIAQLIQAILEAEGVRVLTATLVTQIKQIQGKKWIQAGDEAIETEEVVLCAGNLPDVAQLNLEAVGVKSQRSRLILNRQLQTTHPRIYACGDAIGGYQFANVANYEAGIALKNALFFSKSPVDYRSIPWAVFCDPPLARVGLSERQARRYGEVVVLRQYFKRVAAAQLQMATIGVCKLVLLPNKEIIGAAVIGSQAVELIHVLSLAIAQNMKIDAIANLAPIYPSFSEIFDQIAILAHQANTNHSNRQNRLERFFNFRRSWNL